MDPVAVRRLPLTLGDEASARGTASSPTGGADGLNGAGLAIIAVASLIRSLNETSHLLVSKPFAVWLDHFLTGLWVNALVGAAIVLAAVRARRRHPSPGRGQYASVFTAVLGVSLLAAIALEVDLRLGVVALLAALWAGGQPGPLARAGASVAVAAAIVLGVLTYETRPLQATLLAMAADVLRFGVVGLLVAAAWLYTRTEVDNAAAIAQCALDSARLDEQTAEARLQMLEAQIEPHFLFNTLAHVKRLYETDPVSGAGMLRNLEAYLAVALPQMRASGATLGRELDHVTSYLEIQKIRMGRRLAYAIDVDDGLRSARLPPLMLLTLVENAIKHGLTPLPGGGRIDIRAQARDGRLRVEVADTGVGFTTAGGQGTGLANIRARLAAQFGQDASLALAMNSPRGVVATIELPCVRGDAERGRT